MANGNFGVPDDSQAHHYEANFKGPLIPLKAHSLTTTDLVATHQDPNATLGLTGSAQSLKFDTSVVPHRVSGEASFFSTDSKDMLHCTFAGTVPPTKAEPQKAFVHLVFTGGTGQFEHATGTGTVEADLFPSRGFSQGKVVGKVIVPGQH